MRHYTYHLPLRVLLLPEGGEITFGISQSKIDASQITFGACQSMPQELSSFWKEEYPKGEVVGLL